MPAPQPLDVGMTPYHARSRAGHIRKNTLKRLAIPPFLRLGGIAVHKLRRQSQPPQILSDALQALLILVHRHHFYLRAFQYMRRLAARCGTDIQHAHPVADIQQPCGILRTGVLHRN